MLVLDLFRGVPRRDVTRRDGSVTQEKAKYKDAFEELRSLKREIEHLHMLLEQSRTRLQRDFEQWMGLMARQGAQQQQQQSPQAAAAAGASVASSTDFSRAAGGGAGAMNRSTSFGSQPEAAAAAHAATAWGGAGAARGGSAGSRPASASQQQRCAEESTAGQARRAAFKSGPEKGPWCVHSPHLPACAGRRWRARSRSPPPSKPGGPRTQAPGARATAPPSGERAP